MTVRTYMAAAQTMFAYFEAEGLPTDPLYIKRDALEMWIIAQRETMKPATITTRYRSVQQFFRWLVDEGEIKESPMARMRAPAIPEPDTPVLTDGQVKALLAACDGRTFEDRRDTAIIRMLIDTGMRRTEIASILLTDLDIDAQTAHIMGKGRRPRTSRIGRKTSVALDRYLRERKKHRLAYLPELWLGLSGPLTGNGVYKMIRRRAQQAGVGQAWTHLFRHFFADVWLREGGQETDLMRLAGWRSRSMMSRYAARNADERARMAHEQIAPGDRF